MSSDDSRYERRSVAGAAVNSEDMDEFASGSIALKMFPTQDKQVLVSAAAQLTGSLVRIQNETDLELEARFRERLAVPGARCISRGLRDLDGSDI